MSSVAIFAMSSGVSFTFEAARFSALRAGETVSEIEMMPRQPALRSLRTAGSHSAGSVIWQTPKFMAGIFTPLESSIFFRSNYCP